MIAAQVSRKDPKPKAPQLTFEVRAPPFPSLSTAQDGRRGCSACSGTRSARSGPSGTTPGAPAATTSPPPSPPPRRGGPNLPCPSQDPLGPLQGRAGSGHHPWLLHGSLVLFIWEAGKGRGWLEVCWTPFFFMYVVGQFCEVCKPNAHIEQFITWLGYSNRFSSPRFCSHRPTAYVCSFEAL